MGNTSPQSSLRKLAVSGEQEKVKSRQSLADCFSFLTP